MTGTPNQQLKFLTLEELTAILRISQRRLRRAVKAGHLPAQRIGRDLRFDLAEVLDATSTPTTQPNHR